MKARMYITVWAVAIATVACSTTSNFARVMEDDVYYVPGRQSLYVQELEKQSGQVINPNSLQSNHYAPVYGQEKSVQQNATATAYAAGAVRYATQQQVERAEAIQPGSVEVIPLPEDDGYWIGGFHGSEYDLQECVRIMNRYPEGFAFFANGHEIALNLSFSTDWNVYTVNNRYWWFPSPSNIELYSRFLFGTYPTYVMTVIWDAPHFNVYAFDRFYRFRPWSAGIHWGLGWGYGGYYSWGYGGGYWGYYDPWYYDSWYYWRHDPYRHRPHHWYHDHYAGERSNYVARYVNNGRRDASYYNGRTNYPIYNTASARDRNASRSNTVNRQNAEARTNYTRGSGATTRTDNTRARTNTNASSSPNVRSNTTPATTNSSTNARSNYTRSGATTTTTSSSPNVRSNATPATTNSSNNARSNYTRSSATPTTTSGSSSIRSNATPTTTNSSTNARSNYTKSSATPATNTSTSTQETYRQSNSSSSGSSNSTSRSTSTQTTTRQSSSSSSSSGNASYTRSSSSSGSSNSGSYSSGSSSRSSGSSSSGSSRSSGSSGSSSRSGRR